MKQFRYVASSLAVLVFLAGIAFAQNVKTDYDHNVNFSQFHTYYWAQVKTEDPLWEPRVRQAVDTELQAKGWQMVPSNGEVALTAVGASHDQKTYQTFYNGFSGGWYWNNFGDQTTTVQNTPVGTLIVDMYDAQNKKVIWRGTASDAISNHVDKNVDHLEKSVDKMFKDFPPNAKKNSD